jgi:hypothetical protein
MKIINLSAAAALTVFTVTSAAQAASNASENTVLGIRPIQVTIVEPVVLQGGVERHTTMNSEGRTTPEFAFAHPRPSLNHDLNRFQTPVPAKALY